MVWEIVFMLVILKLPVVYLCGVVWYAIRAVPDPLEGAGTRVEPEPREPWSWWRRPRRRPERPHGPPARAAARAKMRP